MTIFLRRTRLLVGCALLFGAILNAAAAGLHALTLYESKEAN
jgi:microcin C transport system substrate-binding protein